MNQLELFPQRFSCDPIRYVTPTQRIESEQECTQLPMSPFLIQELVFELAQNHFLKNSPKSLGFLIDQQYQLDPAKTGMILRIGHDWQERKAGSCPALFIFRDDVQYTYPTMNMGAGRYNVAESEKGKLMYRGMSCSIACIGKTVGFCEQLAEYVKVPFVTYAEVIQRDFKLRKFRVKGVSKPQQYRTAVDNFIVIISMEIWFDEGFILKRDDLKLKTITREIFDGCLTRLPLETQ
jgi:hypothetical protein